MLARSFTYAALLLAIVSAAAQSGPKPPPEQARFCALYDQMSAEQNKYNGITDPFAKQSAKKPNPQAFVDEAVSILGPDAAFNNWVGVIKLMTTDVNGMASLTFLPCKSTIFGTVPSSKFQVQGYAGAGLIPFTYPVPTALIAIPAHSSEAVVSGHLYPLKPHQPAAPAGTFASTIGDDRGQYATGRSYKACAILSFDPCLAAFTKVALPKH